MNYSLQNRNTNFASSLPSRRSLPEPLPSRERHQTYDNRVALPCLRKPASQEKNTSSKWYKEPKIPVQMTSSTLIRMKSNANCGLDNVVRKESNNQLSLNALSFLKRERRMSDLVNEKYQIAPKGMLPFDKSSYIKDVFAKVVSSGDSASLQEHRICTSANPSGDCASQSGSYHRVSALSINDFRSGCNVKYFEEVSFQAKKSPQLQPEGKYVKMREIVDTATKMENLRITLPSRGIQPEADHTRKCMPVVRCDSSGDDTNYNVLIKKKIRKNKKPVVVTCLKNSTVKFVKRK